LKAHPLREHIKGTYQDKQARAAGEEKKRIEIVVTDEEEAVCQSSSNQ
jgi:hypothetical protein